MLKCKNCGYPYKENQMFCDHCGNPLPLDDGPVAEKKWIICPTCKRKIIEDLVICPFCGENLQHPQTKIPTQNTSILWMLGTIFFAINILLYFFYPMGCIFFLTASAILFGITTITNKKLGTILLVITSLFTILEISFYLYIETTNAEFSFLPWSVTTIERPATMVEENEHYKQMLYTTWEEVDGNNLLVLKQDGTYEWYYNKNDLEMAFMKGLFTLENGATIYGDILYEDQDYFYYQINLIKTEASIKDEEQDTKTDDKQTEYIVALSKQNENQLYLENIETQNRISFQKSNNLQGG